MSPKYCEICGDKTNNWIESFDGFKLYICNKSDCIISATQKLKADTHKFQGRANQAGNLNEE